MPTTFDNATYYYHLALRTMVSPRSKPIHTPTHTQPHKSTSNDCSDEIDEIYANFRYRAYTSLCYIYRELNQYEKAMECLHLYETASPGGLPCDRKLSIQFSKFSIYCHSCDWPAAEHELRDILMTITGQLVIIMQTYYLFMRACSAVKSPVSTGCSAGGTPITHVTAYPLY